MTTQLHYVPIITTDSMRIITGNPNFNYKLICNKICGAAHYNMQMDIIVESEEDYKAWLAEQKNVTEQEVLVKENSNKEEVNNNEVQFVVNENNK
jgi:heme/copper-type cytochrome/quinol oxidase subunit 2